MTQFFGKYFKKSDKQLQLKEQNPFLFRLEIDPNFGNKIEECLKESSHLGLKQISLDHDVFEELVKECNVLAERNKKLESHNDETERLKERIEELQKQLEDTKSSKEVSDKTHQNENSMLKDQIKDQEQMIEIKEKRI